MDNKVIFLDIDGVLNGYNLRVHLITTIMRKCRYIRKYIDIFSVHIVKVFILFLIVKLSKSDIVLSSSWRGGYWAIPYNAMSKRCKKLYILFKIFHINVVGATTSKYTDRGAQIIDYLDKHKEISSYVVIDDEMFDIKEYISQDKLICTKARKNRLIKFKCAGCYDGAGLKLRHIIPTLQILNTKTIPSEF